MNYERDKQWYTNKDLFEMMNEIKLELVETQIQMKKYNDLRRTLNDVMKSQETLTKLVNQTINKVNDMDAASNSRRQTYKDAKDIILLVIAVAGWLLTLIGFFLK
jgi:hypothetical protein